MAKTILSASHSNSEAGTTVAGTTEYWLFGYTSFEKSTTEATREVLYRAPGTLSKLYVRLTANTTSTNGSVTIRKNGADTALSVTVTAGSGAVELEDTSDTVSVAAGDELCIKTVSGGTGTFTMTMVSCIWEATTNTNVRYVAKGYSIATASTTAYLPIAGDRSGTTGTEANVENTIKTAGTIKNGSVNITSNARTNNTTFTVRKNRADTAMIITAGSGVTGHREDTSNSISYAVDDELDWKLTTLTGTQALLANSYAVDYETTTNLGVLTRGCVGSSADYVYTTATTPPVWFMPFGAGNRTGVTTESQVQMKAREAFTFDNLTVYTNSNSIAGNTVTCLRVNGVDSALTVTISSSASGFFADTTHTVTVAASDLINFKITTSAIAGSLSLRQLGTTTEVAAGAAVERALATETTSISEAAFTRLAAKTRTRTDTAIAISENRARLAAKMRPLSTQTTALSESITRQKGKVKTLATETITITGGTLVRLLAKLRAAADTTTISENRQRLGSKSRPLSTQTVALSESLQRINGKIKALATQTVIIGESLARLTSKIRAISLQTIILSDNRARLKVSLRALATQTVAISETRARLKAANRTISIQTVILSENISRLSAKLRVLSLQTIALADSVARQLIGGAVEITRTLSQTVLITDSVARLSRVQRVLSETVPKAETLARIKGKVKLISQTITIGEQAARIKSALRTISQTVTASDSINRLNALRRTVIQTTLIAENVARETLGNLVRSLVETITVSDNIARRTVKLVILAQTVIVVEQARRLSTKLRTIPSQTIMLTDSTTAELNVVIKHAIKTLSQITSITDHLKLEVVKRSQRFRKITTPSIKKLISNHPAWLLGTRGMHSDYEEFD